MNWPLCTHSTSSTCSVPVVLVGWCGLRFQFQQNLQESVKTVFFSGVLKYTTVIASTWVGRVPSFKANRQAEVFRLQVAGCFMAVVTSEIAHPL